jgi:hypothetical protein
MGTSPRTTLGLALLIAVVGGLSGSVSIAIPLILLAVFLIAWGRAPTATESLIGGLPWGDKLLQALRQIDPLISQRQDRWELDDLADRIDWAVQNCSIVECASIPPLTLGKTSSPGGQAIFHSLRVLATNLPKGSRSPAADLGLPILLYLSARCLTWIALV